MDLNVKELRKKTYPDAIYKKIVRGFRGYLTAHIKKGLADYPKN